MIESFTWENAPMRSFSLALATSISYLIVVFSHQANKDVRDMMFIIKNPKRLVAIHNLILCVLSLGMFVGCLYEVILRSQSEESVDWIFCEHTYIEPRGKLWFYSYLYYLSKYYELIDTFLQLLANKNIPNFFLHVYHHSVVILMSWFWVETGMSAQFIGLLFNTAVHVAMYYYYYLRAIGIVPAWKKYVTLFQIVQFVTSLVCFVITMSYVFTRPSERQCKGITVLYGQLIFNASLLYGFVGIFKGGKPKTK